MVTATADAPAAPTADVLAGSGASTATPSAGGTPAAAPEAKPSETAVAPESKAAEKPAADSQTAAPSDYALTLPEGFPVADGYLAGVQALAQQLKLSPEQAQSFVDADVASRVARRDAWQGELKADPNYAGEKMKPAIANVKAAIAAIGGEQAGFLSELLNSSGYGDHPKLFRMFDAFGKKVSESRGVPQGAPATKPDPLRAMFNNSPELFKNGQAS
jgi:hypothetical protein